MAWTNLPTNFINLVWSGLKKYRQYNNQDDTVSFEDVTEYDETEGTQMSADQLNQMTAAINYLMTHIAAEFSTSTYYYVGDYCIYEGVLYRFTSNHSSGAWNASHVTQITTITNDLKRITSATSGSEKLITSGGVYSALGTKTNLSVVASEFNTNTAYAIDDLVIYSGALYRFTSAHSAGAWNASHVTVCSVAQVLKTFGKFEVTGTASAGSSVTITDSRINSNHWKVPKNGIWFGTPANVTTGVHWVTNPTNHTITLEATFTGSTDVKIDLDWYQNA